MRNEITQENLILVTQDHLEQLGYIIGSVSRLWAHSLETFLQLPIRIEWDHIRPVKWGRALKECNHTDIFTTLQLMPLPSITTLSIDRTLAYVFIDRMLGGPGEVFQEQCDRRPTDIEHTALAYPIRKSGEFISRALQDLFTTKPLMSENADMHTIESLLPFEEATLGMRFTVTTPTQEGTIHWIVPLETFRPFWHKLDPAYSGM